MNFTIHWPVTHQPTFNPCELYDGLVLAMVCTGAVYSNRLRLDQVRTLLRRPKVIIEHSAHLEHFLQGLISGLARSLGCKSIIAILKALVLIDVASVWHGDTNHQRDVIDNHRKHVALARQPKLFEPARPGSSSYSVLHQSGSIDSVGIDDWQWEFWVHQERECRFAMIWFLLDSAPVLVFLLHTTHSMDASEIKFPTPAEDAAWDAQTAQECVSALGLSGALTRGPNLSGSQRRKQPEMNLALRALQRPTYEFLIGSTNAFSKFILIHAILMQICDLKKQGAKQG